MNTMLRPLPAMHVAPPTNPFSTIRSRVCRVECKKRKNSSSPKRVRPQQQKQERQNSSSSQASRSRDYQQSSKQGASKYTATSRTYVPRDTGEQRKLALKLAEVSLQHTLIIPNASPAERGQSYRVFPEATAVLDQLRSSAECMQQKLQAEPEQLTPAELNPMMYWEDVAVFAIS